MSVKSAREGSKPQAPVSNEEAPANRLAARTRCCSCLDEKLVQEGAATGRDRNPDRDVAISHRHIGVSVAHSASDRKPQNTNQQTKPHPQHREQQSHEQSSKRLHEYSAEQSRLGMCRHIHI